MKNESTTKQNRRHEQEIKDLHKHEYDAIEQQKAEDKFFYQQHEKDALQAQETANKAILKGMVFGTSENPNEMILTLRFLKKITKLQGAEKRSFSL